MQKPTAENDEHKKGSLQRQRFHFVASPSFSVDCVKQGTLKQRDTISCCKFLLRVEKENKYYHKGTATGTKDHPFLLPTSKQRNSVSLGRWVESYVPGKMLKRRV